MRSRMFLWADVVLVSLEIILDQDKVKFLVMFLRHNRCDSREILVLCVPPVSA